MSGRPYSPAENPHRRHRSSEKMEFFTEMLAGTSSPTGGISSREQCPQETSRQVERAQEQNRDCSATEHDEEMLNDSCAIGHTPASMEVELHYSVNATEGGQPGRQFEEAVDEDNALAGASATLSRSAMLQRKPYSGSTRQLVLAFDVGTTCSGISFCILQPGQVPESQGVLNYPGQGQTGNVKVPSIIYYDSEGKFRAAGYEALKEEVIEEALTEKWVKLEWWKLHLRPKHLSAEHIKDDDIPPLPKGKSAVDVLADFIKYLFGCAEKYIKESYPEYIWQSTKDSIKFIFTHPNGWEGAQQQQIRRAIEIAGLVPSTPDGRSRVDFLTEGEAGLHFCIWDLFKSGVPDQGQYPQGQGVVVIDTGGGTIDLSMYSMKFHPTSFEEIASPECRLQGAIFVSRRAKELLRERLKGSRYDRPDMIEEITETFDQKTKLLISDDEHPAYIKVGSLRENDPEYNIRAGKLTLSGQEATQLFEDSVKAIIDAFEEQRRDVNIPITMVFLIGGFGANDWLWSQLETYFKRQGIKPCRPRGVHKAVPDGAISYFIDHLVKSRVSRATYGTEYTAYVDVKVGEHLSRRDTWYMDVSGQLVVPKAFQGVLFKGVQANELQEFRHKFSCCRASKSEFGMERMAILCYRGTLPDPQWIDRKEEPFSTLCTVSFDLREAAKTLAPKMKMSGQPGSYFSLGIEVIILFGTTEFSAQVAWNLNGVETRGPATMIYDES